MKVPSGLRIDSPSWPLLRAGLSYQGITTLAGDALGTTLVDGLCSTAGLEPSYVGQLIKLLSGDAAGSVRQIAVHNLATGTITVAAPWTDYNGAVYQVPASTQFVILSITGGGGGPPPPPPAPGVGLWMFGVCDPGMGASLNTLVLTNLAGFNDDIFNNEFWIQVIHNADVPGTAPERQIRRVTDYVGATGTFTVDPFLNNVEANDLVAVFHESIMSIEILGFGTLTLSSATVPEDNLRLEVDNYFNGCLFMATSGACRFQPRIIVDWAVGGGGPGTGVFTLDPANPLTGLPGVVDYVIIGAQALGSAAIAPTNGVHAHANNVVEQVAFTIVITRPLELKTLYLDLVNLTQNCTVRVYYQIDGANYREIEPFNWTVGMGDGIYFREIAVDADVQVTVQSAIAEGAIRNIPWKYLLRG